MLSPYTLRRSLEVLKSVHEFLECVLFMTYASSAIIHAYLSMYVILVLLS